MRKILVASDGRHFSRTALNYALHLNSKRDSLIVGMFLSDLYYISIPNVFAETGVAWEYLEDDMTKEELRNNLHTFEDICQREQVEYRTHRDNRDMVMEAIINETRFADLLIVSGQTFYANFFGETVNDALKTTLENAECPVLVVPENFAGFENVVLAYDGSTSAMFAAKQFAYVMREFTTLPTHLVTIVKEGATNIPNQELMTEWTERHFKNLTIDMQPGRHVRDSLNQWMNQVTNPLLVLGSFSRGFFSQLFKESLASSFISEHKFPVFIAHR